MLTENEKNAFRERVYHMYRYGKIGVGALFRSALACLFGRFGKKKADMSASVVYLRLYSEPQEMVSLLFHGKVLGIRDLASHISAFGKRIARGVPTAVMPVGYVPQLCDILEFFEDISKNGTLLEREQIVFAEIIGEQLLNRFLYTSSDPADDKARFIKLFDFVTVDAILKSGIDLYFGQFLIAEKFAGHDAVIAKDCDKIVVSYENGTVSLPVYPIRCRIHRIRNAKNGIQILAEIRCPSLIHFPFSVINFFAILNEAEKVKLQLEGSSGSYYNSFEKTACAYYTRINIGAQNVEKLRFTAVIGGVEMPAECYADSDVFFSACLNDGGNYVDGIRVQLENGCLSFEKCAAISDKSTDNIINTALDMKSDRIWLYCDYLSVKYDNGYIQFTHDIHKNDGIKRYYIAHKQQGNKITAEYGDNIVIFGSDKHKSLFLAAEKIFAAFVDAPNSLIPFEPHEFPRYSAIFNAEIIYLQHGVLHAHIPWRYSPVSKTFFADRIVVSTGFEVENFTKNYHFSKDDLILCGMPRYDRIPRQRVKNNKILYAPSWRAYMDDTMTEHFICQMSELLDSGKLIRFLDENDMYFEFKPHPMFMKYSQKFAFSSDRIRFADDPKPEEYSAFITDFSSYVFDFVYLGIPVIYYFRDYDKFRRGCYQYKNLDIPFEKAFGVLTENADDTVTELEAIAKNSYEPSPIFAERMKSFFPSLENCCERLYIAVNDNTPNEN